MTADAGHDPWIYFIHGTSTGHWREAVVISGERGGGDFGVGFYAFEDTDWGRRSALIWARRKSADTNTAPILVRVKILRSAILSLDREDVSDQALAATYNDLHRDSRTGKQLIVGPVSRRGPAGKRVPNRSLPRQFKFEGSGVIHLTLDEIITIP